MQKFPWNKYAGNPIFSPIGTETHIHEISVLWNPDDGLFHAYYTYFISGSQHIGHATSEDGIHFTRDTENNPVLSPSGSGWDSTDVILPKAWKEGDKWYMIYAGKGSKYQGGLAESNDGIHWTKNSNNPVLVSDAGSWDDCDLDMATVIKVGDTYYLWYSRIPVLRKIGLATSKDLINWTKDSNNPIFTETDSPTNGLSQQGRFCPEVMKVGEHFYAVVPRYTSGTDYARFEVYRDKNPTFYREEREFIGVAITCSPSGWDSHDQDDPWILADDITKSSFRCVNDKLMMYYTGEYGGTWQVGLIYEDNIYDCLGEPRPSAPEVPEVTGLTELIGGTFSIIILAEFLRKLHRERRRKT